MKETGLMFKAPLVRSILDDIKEMTRRVAKDMKHPDYGNLYTPSVMAREPQHVIDRACPYGGPGDRIYVRETWTDTTGGTQYRADWPDGNTLKWRPAIHMPKTLARVWLDITGVRIERLQDISAADAKAEGIEGQFEDGPWRNYQRDGYWFPEGKDTAPILSFRSLWESTGGDWAANPWVWVIDFKRDLAQKGQ